jgi:hypothetical protein
VQKSAVTRVASLFPNESALFCLATALLCEMGDEWLIGKIYLNMNPTKPDRRFYRIKIARPNVW